MFSRRTRIIATTISASVIIIAAIVGWLIYTSYSTVTFTFDDENGRANIASTETGEITIAHNQTIRLKKGEYTLNQFGEHIHTDSRAIMIEDSAQTIAVSFHYTPEYLEKQYEKEAAAIRSALLQEYPRLSQLYRISGSALYEKGQYYGAKLTYRDTKAANRDSLRVLMKKEDDTWRVMSRPPTPVLSAPDFPEVASATLETNNQVK